MFSGEMGGSSNGTAISRNESNNGGGYGPINGSSSDEAENFVVMPYVSMYGSVKEMIDYLSEKLEKAGYFSAVCKTVPESFIITE